MFRSYTRYLISLLLLLCTLGARANERAAAAVESPQINLQEIIKELQGENYLLVFNWTSELAGGYQIQLYSLDEGQKKLVNWTYNQGDTYATVNVPQPQAGAEHSYYLVAADAQGNQVAESNVRNIVLPGKDKKELLQLSVSRFQSSFDHTDKDDDVNHFMNVISISNFAQNPNRLMGGDLYNGKMITLWWSPDPTFPAGKRSIVAVMKMEGGAITDKWARNVWTRTYSWSITYNTPIFDKKEYPDVDVVYSGEITLEIDGPQTMSEADRDAEFALREVSLPEGTAGATFVHTGFYSVADYDSVPAFYYYRLVHDDYGSYEPVGNEEYGYTNIAGVPIYKMNYSVKAKTYTKEQVKADGEGDSWLPVSDSNEVTFQVFNSAAVEDIKVYRSNDGAGNSYVAQAVREQDGTYSVYTFHDGKQVGEAQRVSNYENGIAEVTIVDDLSDMLSVKDYAARNANYVVVVSTHRRDDYTQINTFGSDVKESPLVSVDITKAEMGYNSYNHDGLFHYSNAKAWEAITTENGRQQVSKGALSLVDGDGWTGYRLWRKVRVDGSADAAYNQWQEVELVENDQITAEYGYNTYIINKDALSLSATNHDTFFAPRVHDENGVPLSENEFDVDYILRAYAYDAALDVYHIAEARSTSHYAKNNDLHTGIDDVEADEASLSVHGDLGTGEIVVDGRGEIEIFSVSGMLMMSVADHLDSRKVDVSSLPAGMYIVSNGRGVAKFVKR